VAEVKRYLKTFEGSKYMADRRERGAGTREDAVVHKRKDTKTDSYVPLGQRLLKEGLLSEEKLDEALMLHWRRGVRIGEVLRELGFIKEKELSEVLKEGVR
jgi:hypothetical protein